MTLTSEENDRISLQFKVAIWPSIYTVSTEKIDFISFVTDFFSTFGFWIGMQSASCKRDFQSSTC